MWVTIIMLSGSVCMYCLEDIRLALYLTHSKRMIASHSNGVKSIKALYYSLRYLREKK